MNEKEIIKAVMKDSNITRVALGEKCGYKSKSSITEIMSRAGMKVDIFQKLLSAMDCEIIVRKKTTGKEWKLGDDTTTPIEPTEPAIEQIINNSVREEEAVVIETPSSLSNKKIKLLDLSVDELREMSKLYAEMVNLKRMEEEDQ